MSEVVRGLKEAVLHARRRKELREGWPDWFVFTGCTHDDLMPAERALEQCGWKTSHAGCPVPCPECPYKNDQ